MTQINAYPNLTNPVTADMALLDVGAGEYKHATLDDLARAVDISSNFIINGNFDIAQRGTSFAAIANGAYSLDRWRYAKGGTMVHTISRDTGDIPSSGSPRIRSLGSLKVDCTTADTVIDAGNYCLIEYRVEGHLYQNLKNNIATLSFWVKATKAGTYCVSFKENGVTRSYVAEYTVNVTDTWEYKTITLTFDQTGGTEDYNVGTGLYIDWALALGSAGHTTAGAWQTGNYSATSNQVNACDSASNNFWLSQVKLELGAVATPFVSRGYGAELALCQRYYWRGGQTGFYTLGAGVAINTTIVRFVMPFPVFMRAAPSITHSGSFEITPTGGSVSSFSTSSISTNRYAGNAVVTGVVAKEAHIVRNINDTTTYTEFDAEL